MFIGVVPNFQSQVRREVDRLFPMAINILDLTSVVELPPDLTFLFLSFFSTTKCDCSMSCDKTRNWNFRLQGDDRSGP